MAIGTIVFVSRNGGMLVIQHDEGWTLVELLGDEGALVVGQQVKGDWTAHGGEPIHLGPVAYDAYFQGCWGNKDQPIRMAWQQGDR